MSADRESALCLPAVQERPSWLDRSHRPKTISGTRPAATTISPHRHVARAAVRAIFSNACDDTQTTHRQIASTLDIGERVVSEMAAAESRHNIQAADLVCLAIAGRRVGVVCLERLLRFAEGYAAKLGKSERDHVHGLVVMVGRLAASTDARDRDEYALHLRQLRVLVEEAIRDAAPESQR